MSGVRLQGTHFALNRPDRVPRPTRLAVPTRPGRVSVLEVHTMKRWSNGVWALLTLLSLSAAPAFAQGGGASSTGSISGDVKDSQGGVLPGVTVTATSPAQIGQLTAVTNEAGIYRFPSVPPGEYRLAFELSGFQTVERTGIRVTLGFNAQVNVQLGVASVQETITVSGESPVVDTSTTRIQTNFDQQALASIPN